MVFVTVGSQRFQFDRLLKAVDELAERGVIEEEIFAQTGDSEYQPKNFAFKKYLDRDEYANIMGKCSVVITHGGTGAIIGAVKKGKKVLAMARLQKYGEHVDDHQLQLLKQFEETGLICVCGEGDSFEEKYREMRQKNYKEYVSNTGRWIAELDGYIKDVFGE